MPPPPFFIVGPSRSGSTLLARMLDAHPALAVFPETWAFSILSRYDCVERFSNPWQYILFMNEMYRALVNYDDPAAAIVAAQAAETPRYTGPTRPVLQKLGGGYVQARSAVMWGEKTPAHALRLPEVHTAFPEARLICIVRDPRDILVSYADRWNDGQYETAFLLNKAALVRYYLRSLLDSDDFARQQIHWVRYEALTSDPEGTLGEIADFLGVGYEGGMLGFHQEAYAKPNSPAEPFHRLLNRPVTARRVGRYQDALTPNQTALIERFLQDEMEELGYTGAGGGPTSGVEFTARDERLAEQAQERYEKMIDGVIRGRIERKARLKLWLYRVFGAWLCVIPRFQVAVTADDWHCRQNSRNLRQSKTDFNGKL